MRKVLFLVLISLVCALLPAYGGSTQTTTAHPSPSPTPPPAEPAEDVIRIKTNLVQVDVVVVDNDGRQVQGLTTSDFKIIDNSRERVPEFLSYVALARQPGNEPSVAMHPSADQLGRVFVFVVSNPVLQIGISSAGRGGGSPRTATFSTLASAVRSADSAQSLLTWFVQSQMTAADLAAITSTDVDLGVLSSFTNDRAVLDAAIKRVREAPRAPPLNVMAVDGDLTLQPLVKLNLQVLETLENVIKQVESLPGRKVVTFMSNGLLYNPQLPYYQIINERLERLITRANAGRVAIYTLHTRDLSYYARSFGNDALVHLARETGGRAIYNTNDLRAEFDRVIEENRGYYLLAYSPGADVEGRPARIEVQVNRPGLKVLSRSEGQVQKAASAKSQLDLNPFETPLSANDIRLNISPSLESEKVVTSCRVDLSEVAVRPGEGGRQSFSLGLSIRVTGPDGRVFKKADRDLDFDVPEAELAKARHDGVLSTFSFPGEKPGFYRISVAVRDNNSGKVGNSRVFFEVSSKR